ncbi:MAG: hypothetical protein AAB869_04640 [Patescibacteria group bacterium]
MCKESNFVDNLDDVPPKNTPSANHTESTGMTEDAWILLKKELQEALFRAEQAENPAFKDDVFIDWINNNSGQFDMFYQMMKRRSPEILFLWRNGLEEEDAKASPALIREWVAFRDQKE